MQTDQIAPVADTGTSVSKLFSPGPVAANYNLALSYSHRSDEFKFLYSEVSARLLQISGYRSVVMTQGSASSAIETVLSSVLKRDSRILILVNGEFGKRAARMASYCTRLVTRVGDFDSLIASLRATKYDFCFVVQFETSLSIFNRLGEVSELCKENGVHLIVDAVSAFPYYETPNAKFVISTSSKQLKGLPALGLIFFNDVSDLDLVERSDYLNLKKVIEYSRKGQTQHTALIPQIDSLNKSLSDLVVDDLRRSITRNAQILVEGLEEKTINERVCPVVTFDARDPERVVRSLRARGISLYHNPFYAKQYIQVGCFNYDAGEEYGELNHLLRKSSGF